ncbi:hypothetical protein [Halothiobacillus sp.]|uniref:hypothetical protein n=1 Tax=Halothiobacillus sp. TaxID=1891311 RepID=UPI003D09DC45
MGAGTLVNVISLLLIPIIWWQFKHSRSKVEFLALNFATSIIWFTVLMMSGHEPQAAVSLAAGVTSIVQAFIHRSHPVLRQAAAITSIAIALWISPPVAFMDYLPVVAYLWMRFAEAQDETTMRVMVIVSPVLWSTVMAYDHVYVGLLVDLMVIYLSMQWVISRMPKSPQKHKDIPCEASPGAASLPIEQ